MVIREGAHIIHADESRLQLFRHKPGQLDSLKDLNLEELEALRNVEVKALTTEHKQRLVQLQTEAEAAAERLRLEMEATKWSAGLRQLCQIMARMTVARRPLNH